MSNGAAVYGGGPVASVTLGRSERVLRFKTRWYGCIERPFAAAPALSEPAPPGV